MPLGCNALWLQSDFYTVTVRPAMQCVCLNVGWFYSVCVVMPVVTHQAVEGSAVRLLIVWAASHLRRSSCALQPRKQEAAAAGPRAHWQRLLKDHIARSSRVKKWRMPRMNASCHTGNSFDQVASIFISFSIFYSMPISGWHTIPHVP